MNNFERIKKDLNNINKPSINNLVELGKLINIGCSTCVYHELDCSNDTGADCISGQIKWLNQEVDINE